jgi:hypothetical protein
MSLTTFLLDMNIHLWYNSGVEQWRWTMSSTLNPKTMESGNSSELKVALEDIGKTIEYLMEENGNESRSPCCKP